MISFVKLVRITSPSLAWLSPADPPQTTFREGYFSDRHRRHPPNEVGRVEKRAKSEFFGEGKIGFVRLVRITSPSPAWLSPDDPPKTTIRVRYLKGLRYAFQFFGMGLLKCGRTSGSTFTEVLRRIGTGAPTSNSHCTNDACQPFSGATNCTSKIPSPVSLSSLD